jgi:hypothetical protein
MNLGEARTYVQEALEPLDVNVYLTEPQAGVTPPAVIIKPSQDWVTRITLGQFQVNMDLILTAQPAGTNEAAMERLESLINEIVEIFPINGFIQAPIGEKIGQADLLTTTLPISVMITE